MLKNKVIILALLLFVTVKMEGIAFAIDLPKTGQTTCYDAAGSVIACSGTGQDGEIQAGVTWPSPRFTVNGDCVTDNLTGLIWVRNPDSITRTWQESLDYANGLDLCGYTDWRLPNVNELESLIHAGATNTATWLNSQGFSNLQQNYSFYWTSTSFVRDYSIYYLDDAWVVGLWIGFVLADTKTLYHYVLPVYGGQQSSKVELPQTGQMTCYDTGGNSISCSGTGQDGDIQAGVAWPSPRFTVNGDCVTDNLTGLIWVKSPDSTTRTWQEALDYANALDLCGYTDWRLPNRKELRSMIHYGQPNTVDWLNTQGFSNVPYSHYWLSTTYPYYYTDNAWIIDMWDGGLIAAYKPHNGFYTWPVRAGRVISIEDLNRDGQVDSLDLGILMSQWGPGSGKSGDFDRDGDVDESDLIILIGGWTR